MRNLIAISILMGKGNRAGMLETSTRPNINGMRSEMLKQNLAHSFQINNGNFIGVNL